MLVVGAALPTCDQKKKYFLKLAGLTTWPRHIPTITYFPFKTLKIQYCER